jgi:CRP-like cAMP-binding protein
MERAVKKETRPPESTLSLEGRTNVFEPGPATELFELKTGLVRIYAPHQDGHSVTLKYVKPGDHFGLEALGGGHRVVGAEMLRPSDIETYDPAALSASKRTHVLEQAVLELDAQLKNARRFATLTLRETIASEITALIDTPFAGLDRGKPAVWLTHEQLAELVGSVRETVTKLVGELIEEDLLESRYKRLRVLDAERLANVADGWERVNAAA